MSNSIISKKALAQSLKELIKTKSFDKITVSDITDNCGLNRQSFYYHFQDKYELANWIYYNDVISVVVKDRTFEDWSDGFLEMLSIMKSEQFFYSNIIKIIGQNSFQDYLFQVAKEFFSELINKIAEGKHINDDDKNFIAEFYTFGFVGSISKWIKDGMKETPEMLTLQIKHLVEDSKKFAVERYLKEIPENQNK